VAEPEPDRTLASLSAAAALSGRVIGISGRELKIRGGVCLLSADFLAYPLLKHQEGLHDRMTTTVPFINSLSSGVNPSTARAYYRTHDTESEHFHSHGPGEHGHAHEHLDHPGGSFRSSMIRKLRSVTCRQIFRTGYA